MVYKSIFTALTDKALVKPLLEKASALAADYGAHLDVLCLGVDRTQVGYYYAGASAAVIQETMERTKAEAVELEELAKAELTKLGGRWSTDSAVAQLGDLGRHVAARARFTDIAVLPTPYGEGRGMELEPVVEAAMFDGQVPVIVVPDAATPSAKPKRIVVAWNESREALDAIRAALPILITAENVHITVIDPPVHGPNRSDPGGMLAQYLSRHGIHAEIDVLSKTVPRISDVLRRHASEIGADMIVMGAYGHSRFREAILGGATRNMLEEAHVPVFMSH
ncbi:universal stress protein [Pseudooceanicola sp. 502str34]|uniref:universal stress protein n=1 Tax=Maritimibacter alkaliphilus TaxID=404236 RepID=UPI001C959F8C|nr:universal stress protein [Maritimibacter alkaliphilus]MBY6091291.1 universal stress protein [Maritimibacter alkaliphilus]